VDGDVVLLSLEGGDDVAVGPDLLGSPKTRKRISPAAEDDPPPHAAVTATTRRRSTRRRTAVH
jgi:hypothetical protein